MAEGQCIYQGNIPGLVPFLNSQALICPPYHNPADYGQFLCVYYIAICCWSLISHPVINSFLLHRRLWRRVSLQASGTQVEHKWKAKMRTLLA